MGETTEQEATLDALQHSRLHPLVLRVTDGFTYVAVGHLLTMAMRIGGWQRLPGKSPIGGLAYKLRGKR